LSVFVQNRFLLDIHECNCKLSGDFDRVVEEVSLKVVTFETEKKQIKFEDKTNKYLNLHSVIED